MIDNVTDPSFKTGIKLLFLWAHRRIDAETPPFRYYSVGRLYIYESGVNFFISKFIYMDYCSRKVPKTGVF